jgi:hypothetical protein
MIDNGWLLEEEGGLRREEAERREEGEGEVMWGAAG